MASVLGRNCDLNFELRSVDVRDKLECAFADDVAGMAGRLVQVCLDRRSADNISVIVVHLRAPPPGGDRTDSATPSTGITSTDPVVTSGRQTPETPANDQSVGAEMSRVEFDSPCQGQVSVVVMDVALGISEGFSSKCGFQHVSSIRVPCGCWCATA